MGYYLDLFSPETYEAFGLSVRNWTLRQHLPTVARHGRTRPLAPNRAGLARRRRDS
jgi:hypothetical protein